MESVPDEGSSDSVEICGLIMPISAFGNYDSNHWKEVQSIIELGISKAGFQPKPVWESADTDIIHSRIITNIFANPIAVCDISGLNPNVMFELGLRLSSRKPVVIIADNETDIPFDTKVIEHHIYDRNLNFSAIGRFIGTLAKKIEQSVQSSKSDKHKPYLDLFGAFTVIQHDPEKIAFEDFALERLSLISDSVDRLRMDFDMTTLPVGELVGDFTLSELRPHALGNWTLPRLVRLVEMWHEGLTASQIADSIGNVSRNAVIGKAHRLGLKSRPSPVVPNSERSLT